MMGTFDDDIYRPQQLSDEECWSLLCRLSLSGRSEEECGEFEDVGKKIARKCKGLPLAANVLGSLLQFKDSLEEWENVWKSEIWQLEKAEVDLFPHLVLSYNELSPALKRCFSYCAIYPKDFKINAKRLIAQWMALGYLGSLSENGWELKGRDYFNNLVMRSLLQGAVISVDMGEQIAGCKMHDIVHDFAQFLRKNNATEMRKRSCQDCDHPCLVSQGQEYRSLFWDKRNPPDLCDCLTSLRVLTFNRGLYGIPLGMEELIHLRLLELNGTPLSTEDLKIICRLYLLQTLSLAHCSLKKIPQEIGNLIQLRQLNLSYNTRLTDLPESVCSLLELQILLLACCSLQEIPDEIGSLVHLRNLDLSYNTELKKLPESMCSLIELQILNIEFCSSLNGLPEGIHMLENLQQLLIEDTPASHHFPKGLGELSGLRTLSSFHGGSGRNKLGLLKHLNCLTRSLKLVINLSSYSDLEELVEEAGKAELRNKIHLQSLEVVFNNGMDKKEWSSSSASSLWMEVIEALEPNPKKLKILQMEGYKGSRLPHWMSSPLNLLKEISLFEFSEVWSLPPLGKLPMLEVLYLDELRELKFLGIESSSTSSNHLIVAFPKLKELTFRVCVKWVAWEDITAEEEESAAVSVMPCLTQLTIRSCGDLKKLPHRLLRKASSSLKNLDIVNSSKLQKSYGDKNGSAWRSISQNNRRLKLRLS